MTKQAKHPQQMPVQTRAPASIEVNQQEANKQEVNKQQHDAQTLEVAGRHKNDGRKNHQGARPVR
jgi:hypothetical protein